MPLNVVMLGGRIRQIFMVATSFAFRGNWKASPPRKRESAPWRIEPCGVVGPEIYAQVARLARKRITECRSGEISGDLLADAAYPRH